MEEQIHIKIWAIIFFILLYLLGMIVSGNIIKKSYAERQERRDNFITTREEAFLYKHEKQMVTLCLMFFPLYYAFKYGELYGKLCYKILTNNRYENRLASWLF